MMRGSVLFALGLVYAGCSPALAQTGFYLPTTATSYGQDEFRAADGTTCRSSMDGAKRVEFGTYVSAGQNPYYGVTGTGVGIGYGGAYSAPVQGNTGVYGRFSMSLDARSDRMDCNKLFELEMERRRLEVEIMKRSLNAADRELDALRSRRQGRRESSDHEPFALRGGDATAPRQLAEISQTGSVNKRSVRKGEAAKRSQAPL